VTGFRISISNLKLMLQFFWGLARGQVPTAMLGGPIRIVQLASESARWGASYFFGFMAFLSLNLFLVNLLPLPILDGGHLVLLALEKVRGRRITDRALLVWQQVGLIFFVSLMIVLLVMDAIRVA
jgi:regulator of sigma E protease